MVQHAGKPKAAAERTRVIKEMLAKIEDKMGGNQMKATLADYIRLVQLHKELDEESPKEIRVTWVEPAVETALETTAETTIETAAETAVQTKFETEE